MMEKLYNNIMLPDDFAAESSDASHVPYLEKPPEVIDVSVGRQLFVDDFLIQETDLKPVYHTAKKYEGNPVLRPETAWETVPGGTQMACPFGSGLIFDPKDKLFKTWYMSDFGVQLCYAFSEDGIHWIRPNLDEVPGTNIILPYEGYSAQKKTGDIHYLRPDTVSMILDPDSPDDERFKLVLTNPSVGPGTAIAAVSADGIHFRDFRFTSRMGDASTFFYNPFRKKYVYSIRSYDEKDARIRDYHETGDFRQVEWQPNEQHFWMRCDSLDQPHPYIGFRPQLYRINGQAYESITLGMFQIFYGPENEDIARYGVPKITEVMPMYSRDGYHFSRPCRDSLVNATFRKGDWDRGYITPVGGMTIIHGDELWLYYCGFAGDESRKDGTLAGSPWMNGMYCNGSMGIAKMRRDGFVSMNGNGTLLTRKLEAHGKKTLHINAKGRVSAQILSEEGEVLAESEAFEGDSTNALLHFGDFSVESCCNQSFRLRFECSGELYAFGFADENGCFNGKNVGFEVIK